MNCNHYKKALDVVASCTEGYFGYIDTYGYPHVATRSLMKINGLKSFYFSTNTSGSMAQALLKDQKASICFRVDNSNVTLVGDATIIEDPKTKSDLWLDWFINHYPQGPTDPEYTVIRFDTNQLSCWLDQEVVKTDMKTLLTVTSRCGLMCQSCEWKESHNCPTCIASNGHPFYGECPIAICAQNKGLDHCGQCTEMPCERLETYSCGESEHADQPKGARLDMLRLYGMD